MKTLMGNLIAAVLTLAVCFAILVWSGVLSWGYKAHFANIDGEFTGIEEHYIEILGEKYIYNTVIGD